MYTLHRARVLVTVDVHNYGAVHLSFEQLSNMCFNYTTDNMWSKLHTICGLIHT